MSIISDLILVGASLGVLAKAVLEKIRATTQQKRGKKFLKNMKKFDMKFNLARFVLVIFVGLIVEKDEAVRKARLEELLQEFSITHIRKSHALSLSGGERRRVEIARALASNPSFILLDEPFAGIDPIAVNDIRLMVSHLTSKNIGVLITDHNVRETLSIVDRAYIVYDGMILTSGGKEEIVNNIDVKKVYLGEDFRI